MLSDSLDKLITIKDHKSIPVLENNRIVTDVLFEAYRIIRKHWRDEEIVLVDYTKDLITLAVRVSMDDDTSYVYKKMKDVNKEWDKIDEIGLVCIIPSVEI